TPDSDRTRPDARGEWLFRGRLTRVAGIELAGGRNLAVAQGRARRRHPGSGALFRGAETLGTLCPGDPRGEAAVAPRAQPLIAPPVEHAANLREQRRRIDRFSQYGIRPGPGPIPPRDDDDRQCPPALP